MKAKELHLAMDKIQNRYLKDLQEIALEMFGVEWNEIKNMDYHELDLFMKQLEKERGPFV